MAVLDIRQRTGWLFLVVTVGHIILISTQVNTRRGVPLLEAFTFGAFAEVQRGATSAVGQVQDGWQNYFALQQIRRENETLKQQVSYLNIKLQQEQALAQQSRELQKLLQMHNESALMTTGASVIGGAPSPEFRTLTIDKGSHDGLKTDMAVMSPYGVVGRVIMPTRRASKVQMLIDRNAAAGALIERTRAQGVVVGTGADRLRLEYVASSADVKVGDRVATSGIDGIYPKGFVIGTIEAVKGGTSDLREITIKPAVDFSAVEAVLVVLTPPGVAEPDAAEPVSVDTSNTPKKSPPPAAPVSRPAVNPAPKPAATAASQVPQPTAADPADANEER